MVVPSRLTKGPFRGHAFGQAKFDWRLTPQRIGDPRPPFDLIAGGKAAGSRPYPAQGGTAWPDGRIAEAVEREVVRTVSDETVRWTLQKTIGSRI